MPRKLVAENDINVFKIIRSGLYSFYYRFEYRLNTHYSLQNSLSIIHAYTINEGFHSYHKCCIKYYKSNNLYCVKGYKLCNRSNSLFVLDSFSLDESIGIMKCIIPKGSTYYENEHGECVSDQIIPIEVLPLQEYKNE